MSTLQVLLRRAGLDDEQDLEDRYGITVTEDGLVEPERITPKVARLIGDLPIALWHFTSSALLKKIHKHGLVVPRGKATNLFNSRAGVYLATTGVPNDVADLYAAMAVSKHGGEPIAIRVRRTLDQIRQDPDDADLAWAVGRQFITDPPVPPEDLKVPWESNPPKLDGLTKHQRMVVEDFVRWIKLRAKFKDEKYLLMDEGDLSTVLHSPRDYLDLSSLHMRMFKHRPRRPGMGRWATPEVRTLQGKINPPMRFLTDCTCADGDAINDMKDQAVEIPRRAFLKHVDRASLKEIERSLGYGRGFTMAGDWHVSYYQSVYEGRPVVYFTHSAIEHIFMHGA